MRTSVMLAAVLLIATFEARPEGLQSTRPADAPEVSNALVGRVLNNSGAPIEGALVTLERMDEPGNAAFRLQPVNSRFGVRTHERGEFEFTQLPAAQYLVLVSPPDTQRSEPTGMRSEPTYYPGTTNRRDAEPVRVGMTGRVTADITLVYVPTFTISGYARTLMGETFQRAVLRVTPAATPSLFTRGQRVADDGSFIIRDVPRGTYCLRAIDAVWPPRDDDAARTAFARVTVERDVTNIRVAPIGMVKITGRVTTDARTRDQMAINPVRIAASLDESSCMFGMQRSSVIRGDLTFELQTWPGAGTIELFLGQLAGASATVRVNGKDVTRAKIDFREGQNISGVDVEINRGSMPRVSMPPLPAIVSPPPPR